MSNVLPQYRAEIERLRAVNTALVEALVAMLADFAREPNAEKLPSVIKARAALALAKGEKT